MAHALPKTTKRGDSGLRLRRIKWNNFAAEVFDQPVQRQQRLCSPPSHENDASFKQRDRTQLSRPRRPYGCQQRRRRGFAENDCDQHGCVNYHAVRAICLPGEAEFVISKDFVDAAGVQDRQCRDLRLDGFDLLQIDWARRIAQFVFQRSNHRLSKGHTPFSC
jgi:hypothetical protein